MVPEGTAPRIIFDKSVSVKQLNVVEAHGLLIFLADKGEKTLQCMSTTGALSNYSSTKCCASFNM